MKLDLYCKGMRLDDCCLVEQDGGRKVLRTRAGLGSGLEVVLPGGLWTNVPVAERFAQSSPYVLHREGRTRTCSICATTPVATLELSPRPAWYDRKTTTGKPMTRIGTLQGTYLGVYPAKVCEYWTEKPQKANCKFCSVGLNLGVDDADEKSVDEVMEVVRAAREESGITYVDFNTGHYEGDTYLDILEPYIRRIKQETGLLVGVQTPPHHDLRRYDALREHGRQSRLVLLRDLRPASSSRRSAPASTAEYGLERYLEAVALLRRARPEGAASRAVGHERRDHRRPRAAGVLDPRDRLDHLGGRDPDRVRLPAARRDRLRGRCRRRRRRRSSRCSGGSTKRAWRRGCRSASRPNVHVSLVLLPEECRSLSDRRFPLRALQLKLMGRAARAMVGRNVRAAMRSSARP